MDINQNQININPVDIKSLGFSALPSKPAEKQAKVTVVEEPKKAVEQKLSLAGKLEKQAEVKRQKQSEAEELSIAVVQINEQVQNLQRNLVFTVDEHSGEDIVTVMDSQSEKVIRQIPSVEALALSRRLEEQRNENDIAAVVNLFKSIA